MEARSSSQMDGRKGLGGGVCGLAEIKTQGARELKQKNKNTQLGANEKLLRPLSGYKFCTVHCSWRFYALLRYKK